MTQAILMPVSHVAQAWPLAVPFLSKAEKAGALQSVAEWMRDCLNGTKQLWLLWAQDQCHGAGITSLIEAPQGKTCVIDGFAAQTGSAWLPTLEVVEAWARSQGCVRVRVYGRVGWTEKLKDYALKGVILDRKL